MRGGFCHVTGITDLSHRIIAELFPEGGSLAIDCTLGNGHDADFLAEKFDDVIAMDIQKSCIENYREPGNVRKYCMDHADIERFNAAPALMVYNLGYRPGGDKAVRTRSTSTVASLAAASRIIAPGGFIIIGIYWKHDEGEEGARVLEFCSSLPKEQFGVLHHTFINRGNQPPSLVIVERKRLDNGN